MVPIKPPLAGLCLLRQGLQFFVYSAATDIANLQFSKDLKKLLVKKTGVQPDDDGYLLPVAFANERDDILDHFLGGVPVIAVLAAAPETPRR